MFLSRKGFSWVLRTWFLHESYKFEVTFVRCWSWHTYIIPVMSYCFARTHYSNVLWIWKKVITTQNNGGRQGRRPLVQDRFAATYFSTIYSRLCIKRYGILITKMCVCVSQKHKAYLWSKFGRRSKCRPRFLPIFSLFRVVFNSSPRQSKNSAPAHAQLAALCCDRIIQKSNFHTFLLRDKRFPTVCR